LLWCVLGSLALVSLSTNVMGCNGCISKPAVEASMQATVERPGQTHAVALQGSITEEGTSEQGWSALRHFLLADISTSSGGASWTVTALNVPEEVLSWLAIQLAGTFQPGELIQVSAQPGLDLAGAWAEAPDGARTVQMAAIGFTVASGGGTLEVLGVGPLRLRIDLLFVSDTGEEMRIQGDMAARDGSQESCN
jgi:hypothetical protein